MFKQVLILDSSIKKCVLFHAPDGIQNRRGKVGVGLSHLAELPPTMDDVTEGCEDLLRQNGRQLCVERIAAFLNLRCCTAWTFSNIILS